MKDLFVAVKKIVENSKKIRSRDSAVTTVTRLQAIRPEVRILTGVKDLQNVLTGSGFTQPPISMGTEGKAAGN
jgi:hypothetical protein